MSSTLAARDEEFWKTALDRAQLGVWDWDLRTNDCFYSETWARMLGYKLAELPAAGDLWLQLTHPDDRERAIASGERHLAGLTDTIETEIRFRHKNGEWVWVLDRGGVVAWDADGRPLRMIGAQTDITRQKAAEIALADVNARFRLALAASGTGIWHHDIGAVTSYWDDRTKQIYGVCDHPGEVPGDLWHGLLHPEDRAEAERAHEAVIGSPAVSNVRYRILRTDGEVRHIESLLRFVSNTGTNGQLLGTVRDITEEVLRERDLAHAARHDALTGLLNRSAFDTLLKAEIETMGRRPLAILYIDLDYFKALNDFAGHAAGDVALKGVAAAIESCLPATGHAARLGGDEFVVLVPGCSGTARIEALARRILEAIAKADLGFNSSGRTLAASIGIAFIDDSGMASADALACADDACYSAKASGRNRYALFSGNTSVSTSGLNAARMASETVEGMEEGRLHLYGQRIVPLAGDGSGPCHAEVLARLVGKNGQFISPAEFIPAAERFGIAPRLDRWIIKTALTRFGPDMAAGRLRLNFNVSAQTLSDPNLWKFVDSAIEETKVPHSGIAFEITETAAVTNFDAAERFVRSARERQCRVSLDDFGAGLSSFDYLRRFPIDSIKIDGSFVQHMAANRFDREIVKAISGIARSLGYAVVAEKIESEAVLEILREMGIDYGQGYLLHRPEPLQDVLAAAIVQPARPHVPRARRAEKARASAA